jgi:hypothetical protein
MNPKDAIGRSKATLTDMPLGPLFLLGEVMRGGAAKYGHYNWRDEQVSTSVYVNAMFRHLVKFWEGHNTDEESGLPHLAHVAASCLILLDAAECSGLDDDRPEQQFDLIVEMLEEIVEDRAD